MPSPPPRRLAPLVALVALGTTTAAAPARAADPTTQECLTANEVGLKLRHDKALREARDRLLVCTAPTCPNEVRSECARLVADVGAAIPSLVLELVDAAGNPVAAVRVAVDGEALPDHAEAAPLELDPGSHVFTFDVTGAPMVQKTFVLNEGEKERHERVVLGPDPAPPPPGALDASSGSNVAPTAPTPPVPPHDEPPRRGPFVWTTQHSIAVVAAAVGVVGIGVGAGFGIAASSAWSASKNDCSTSTSCPNHAQAVAEHDGAANDAVVSTIAFGAGAVLVGGAIVLWFTAPRGPASRPTTASVRLVPLVDARGGGAALGGTFR